MHPRILIYDEVLQLALAAIVSLAENGLLRPEHAQFCARRTRNLAELLRPDPDNAGLVGSLVEATILLQRKAGPADQG